MLWVKTLRVLALAAPVCLSVALFFRAAATADGPALTISPEPQPPTTSVPRDLVEQAPPERPTETLVVEHLGPYEIRWDVGPSSRITRGDFGVPTESDQSLSLKVEVGLRAFSRKGHGVVTDGIWRWQADICLLDCGSDYSVDMTVAGVGYGYRYAIYLAKKPKMAFTVTPRLEFVAGIVRVRPPRPDLQPTFDSPVLGGRLGFDMDIHVSRWFFGWGYSVEVLAHTRGPIERTTNFDWKSVMPFIRMGVDLGPRI